MDNGIDKGAIFEIDAEEEGLDHALGEAVEVAKDEEEGGGPVEGDTSVLLAGVSTELTKRVLGTNRCFCLLFEPSTREEWVIHLEGVNPAL